MKKNITKLLILSAILLLFLSCSSNSVKNKVFVNSSVLIILFDDGTCSYSGILSGTYKYNSKTKILVIDYKDNKGIRQKKNYTYDSGKNCLYDDSSRMYEYRLKASEVKIEGR